MISIIMPVYNQHAMTQECVNVLCDNTDDFELILIDNGSTPPIEEMFFGQNTIRNETNFGFPVAVNQGIRASHGDIIILLNNDVIVTPGWADRLLAHLANYSIVSPLANYCAGLQQQVALDTYSDDNELFAASDKWYSQHAGEFLEVNFVIGFCMAFPRSLYDELGPFDESIWPCSGEELDFCFRAREAGHKIVIARDTYVHHIGSQTFDLMQKEGSVDYIKLIARNDAHLEETWGPFWENQLGDPPKRRVKSIKKSPTRLNLGCGNYHIESMTNIDQFPHVFPDIIADVLNLPYEPDTIDEIYCGHLLEHLTWEEGQTALRHWHSILKRGGEIMLTTPDFDYLVRDYLANPTAKKMRKMNDWYIYSYVQESPHKYCYGPSLLKAAMTEAGFGEVTQVTKHHPYFTSPMEDQITFRGIK